MEKVEILIIGAGVVGLAIAAELSKQFDDGSVVLLERHSKFGQETSSRNSEVIHAGIYYPTGSLKAKLCVEGNQKLYQFCQEWEIPHKRIGKLIIARNEEEIPALESILTQGRKNGVNDLELLDKDQIAKLEPNIRAAAGLLSPSTGIIDSHKLMLRLEWLALAQGAIVAYNHKVIGINPKGDGYHVTYHNPAGQLESIHCRWLINCAGLTSDQIFSFLGINIDDIGYRIYPCKGEYFSVSNTKSALVSRLIYPPPLKDLKGLGIHATKALDGRLRFGPNAIYTETLDYDVNEDHAQEFYNAVNTYMPFLKSADFHPDMAGIRPKIQAPGDPIRDFIVCHEVERGFEGLINLIGIESPGLTSSLTLAEMVKDLIH
ncbi:NAD(P)/FAD-dependent oxidoreductase [Desulfosporosinus nitroreducens]|uniref:NAD(P)/FAD-dependent oxidoreductase n=1 Tax=Desulfosporosinus nitroreducens TaxID=2018668 RepID=A0ABT8QPH5_9FIRM|nr:NAD(P)/FAD-dependent oxidoreductase [Desulfosporosinus nitroreducens]MCO1602127.1 NAD(P)/FAD-dependent oxidoreductase [Desulfosporosinus nitroreducens]MDO0823254.1 NAD(P)/FAD-dependent oxidoreductase [Desulfosporosinus nitroreducens]